MSLDNYRIEMKKRSLLVGAFKMSVISIPSRFLSEGYLNGYHSKYSLFVPIRSGSIPIFTSSQNVTGFYN